MIMRVLVTKEDSWKLDASMFVIEGSWETGYVLNKDIFFMVGVWSYYEVGEHIFLDSLEADIKRHFYF